MGACDGVSEGSTEGERVGTKEGQTDGERVGTTDGLFDGECVGPIEGLTVVGAGVGVFVGTSEGA